VAEREVARFEPAAGDFELGLALVHTGGSEDLIGNQYRHSTFSQWIILSVPAMLNHDMAMDYLSRHCVLLCWIDQTPGTLHGNANSGLGKPFTVSAFLISMRNNWFLVTAGHVLGDIEKARTKGQILTDFKLDDTFGVTAKFKDHSVPFVDFDQCWKQHVDLEGMDFGVIQISQHTGTLLQSEPVAENCWKDIPTEFEHYYLLGAPDPLQVIDTVGGLHFRHVLAFFEVEPISDPPETFVRPSARVFYRIPKRLISEVGKQLDDIDGMSGCPLIGVKESGESKGHYYFLGIQSGWDPRSRLAWATPLKGIGEWLEKGFELLESRHASSTAT
jgi:hypothetical protein